jgi:hypothetical protein
MQHGEDVGGNEEQIRLVPTDFPGETKMCPQPGKGKHPCLPRPRGEKIRRGRLVEVEAVAMNCACPQQLPDQVIGVVLSTGANGPHGPTSIDAY